MDYRIVEKAAFTVVGFSKRFAGETSYIEVPKFWDEHYENGRDKIIEGMFGVCLDGDGDFSKLTVDDSAVGECLVVREDSTIRDIYFFDNE